MPSPKTAKKGKPNRLVPFFPNSPIARVLNKEFERQGKPKIGFVIQDICNLNASDRSKTNWDQVNPATTLKRHIRKAGVQPWQKLCQNIRVTRENELLASGEYRSEVVHAIIGHTRKTFEQSYESLVLEDFKPRSRKGDDSHPDSQRIHRANATQTQNKKKSGIQTSALLGITAILDALQKVEMPRAGLEPAQPHLAGGF
jgi:hypothetical protein